MYDKMVVLLDGSELAEVVFDFAQELSGRLHIDMDLLHVCSPEEAGQMPMRRAYMEQMAGQLCAGAEKVRAKQGSDDFAQCVVARGNVVIGYPAEEILRYIEANDIDLVMMSTHGSSGVKVWDLGGVANKIIHASKVPVWLVPSALSATIGGDEPAKRRVVVALSGTKESETAIAHAVYVIGQQAAETELVLLHVREAHIYSYPAFSGTESTGLEKELAEKKSYLEGLAEPIRESGLEVRTEVLWGDPAESIIEYVTGHPTQLLVMATMGKGRVNRMIFGSVTESVVHTVKVTPLLLVAEQAKR